MPETIKWNAGELASIAGMKAWLYGQNTGTLLNTGGDSLSDPDGVGHFSFTLTESRTGLGTLYCQLKSSGGVMYRDGILRQGKTQIEDIDLTDVLTAVEAISGAASTAVVAARVPIGSTVGWPVELVIGDARLTALGTAPLLYVKDADDNIITGYGTKNFADADFRAVLRLSPLTTVTRDLDEPPATIEVATDDSPGIIWNDDVSGSEYFELQIPKAQADLGVIRTRYSCQFIMNWGATDIYESTINLGEIEFIRKNDDVAA